MPNRSSSRLQEVSGILSLPPERRHRRLPEARSGANQTALGQGKEVAVSCIRRGGEDLRKVCAFTKVHLPSHVRLTSAALSHLGVSKTHPWLGHRLVSLPTSDVSRRPDTIMIRPQNLRSIPIL